MATPPRTYPPSVRTICALALCWLGLLPTTGAEVLHRLPPTDLSEVQANLARRYFGAEILSAKAGESNLALRPYSHSVQFTDTNEEVTALLCDDSTIGTPIAQGNSEIVIRLHSVHDINRVSFEKRGGSGRVSIHGCENEDALRGNSWSALGYSVLEEGRDTVTVNFGAASARYVRLSFETVSPISLSNFGIFGLATLADYQLEPAANQPSGKSAGLQSGGGVLGSSSSHDFSLLSVAAGTNLIYESPAVGKSFFANNSDASNRLDFRRADSQNTLIFELPSWAPPIDSLGMSYSAPVGQRIQVYFLERLPEQENWLGNRTLDTSFFDGLTPAIDTIDVDRVGRYSSRVASANTRYVAVRMSPAQASASRHLSLLLPLASIGSPSTPTVLNMAAFSSDMGTSGPGFVQGAPFTSPGTANPMADFSSNLFDGRAIFRGLGLPRDGLFQEGLPDALQIVSP